MNCVDLEDGSTCVSANQLMVYIMFMKETHPMGSLWRMTLEPYERDYKNRTKIRVNFIPSIIAGRY